MEQLGPTTDSPATRPSGTGRATFFGTFDHKVSGRNQVAIPKSFMKTLEQNSEGQLLLMRWNNEGFLRIYTQKELDKKIDEIRNTASLDESTKSLLIGHLASAAEPIEPDRQGRFVLPARWVEDLRLKEDVTFCGKFNRIELWPAQARQDHEALEREKIAVANAKIAGIINL